MLEYLPYSLDGGDDPTTGRGVPTSLTRASKTFERLQLEKALVQDTEIFVARANACQR